MTTSFGLPPRAWPWIALLEEWDGQNFVAVRVACGLEEEDARAVLRGDDRPGRGAVLRETTHPA